MSTIDAFLGGGASAQPAASSIDEFLGGGTDAAPKSRGILDKIRDYGLTTASMAGQGSMQAVSAVSDTLGAPVAKTRAMLSGGAALVDRLASEVTGNAQNQTLQEFAQDEAATAERTAQENAANNAAARMALALRDGTREQNQKLKSFDQEFNPELVRQQKEVGKAEGAVGMAKALWDNPMAMYGTLVQSMPAMAGGVAAGNVAARGLGAMGAATGMAPEAAAALATRGASAAGVASEAISSGGGAREGVHASIMALPVEQLAAQSPRFAELTKGGMTPEAAREALANEVAMAVSLPSSLATAGGSMLMNKLLGDTSAKMIAGQALTAKQAAAIPLKEGAEELTQGLGEDYAQYRGMKSADRDAKYDPGASAVQNFLAGVGMSAPGAAGGMAMQKVNQAKGLSPDGTKKAPGTAGGPKATAPAADQAGASAAGQPTGTQSPGSGAGTRSAGVETTGVAPGAFDYGTYDGYRTALESGGNPNARAGTSSATGLHQFTAGTWLNVVAQTKPAWAQGMSREELLAQRTDPARSTQMVQALDRQNSDALRAAGLPVNNYTLYAAHHFGPGAAIKFGRASASTPMADLLTPAQMDANPYLKGKTKGEAIANWDRRAAKAGVKVTPKNVADGAQQESDDGQIKDISEEVDSDLLTPRALTDLDKVGEVDQEIAKAEARWKELDPADGYGPTFDTERAALQQEIADLRTERDNMTQNWPKPQIGKATSFTTETGARLDGHYAVVDVSELLTSHDENLRRNDAFPAALQPRERDRAASEMQISGIVGKLDPARLGLSADAATGAPIIGADGLVESGNARTIALKRIYQADGQKAHDYRSFLAQNATDFGVTPEQVEAVANPVLVRVRDTPVNRAEFARQANASTVAAMSPSEQARSDAARIDTMEDLTPDDNGDFQTSRDFIRRFMSKLPQTEQAAMVDSGGMLSSAGYSRVRNAVLARAYGDSPVLQRLTESLDDNQRNISRALMIAAPQVAKMRQAIEAGARHDVDITADLMAAVDELARLKDDGGSVRDALAQAGMFGDKYSPETRALMQFLAENARRPRKIAEFIGAYFNALDAAGDPNQGSLLGETVAPSKTDLMGAARASTQGETDGHDAGAASAGPQQDAPGRPGDQPSGGQDREQRQAASSREGGDQVDGAAGAEVASEWAAFPPDMGTLGVPRADMPQIKAGDRSAFLQFLEARGVPYEKDVVPASDLKPTQAEFSTEKVKRFAETGMGMDRSVLVSGDGYVLDGHHQMMAHRVVGDDVPVIRIEAPIRELLAAANEFPSVQRSEGATAANDAAINDPRSAAVRDFRDAMADLGEWATKHQRAAIVPSDQKELMPILVKLFDSAIRIVGTDARQAMRWVQQQLRTNPETKRLANQVDPSTYRQAAEQALAAMGQEAEQGGLFGSPDAASAAIEDELPVARPYGSLSDAEKAAFDAASRGTLPVAENSRQTRAAFKNAASEDGAPVRGPAAPMPGSGVSDAPSSANLNQRPSGKPTKSSPEKSATNLEPAGKDSGNFMGTSDASIVGGKASGVDGAASEKAGSPFQFGEVSFSSDLDQTETPEFKRWFSPGLRDVVAGLSEAEIDGLKRNAKALAYFLEGEAVTSHRGGSFNIPRPVLLHVVEMLANDKVLDAVVGAIPVNVVNFLGRKQLPAKEVLHDVAMLEDVLSVNPKSDVSLGVDPLSLPLLTVRVIANAGAEISGLTGGPFKRNAAALADPTDPVLGAHIRDSVNKDLSILRGFGKSKVVDADGKPRVVYHGTAADFTIFQKPEVNKMADRSVVGFWFTSAKSDAAGYGGSLMETYLSIQNPRRITRRKLDEMAVSYPTAEMMRRLKAGGHDGLIIEEIRPDPITEERGMPEQYVAFRPEQIKSATGNTGAFDPAEKDIRLSVAGDGAGAVAPDDVRALAARVRKALPSLPEVHVLAGAADAPAVLRDYIDANGGAARGAYHDGAIYLFTDHLSSMAEAEHVLATHEANHAGLDALLGPDRHRTMQALGNNNDRLYRAAQQLVDEHGMGYTEAIEEVLADMSPGDLIKLHGWRRVTASVASWLDNHGFTNLAKQLRGWLNGNLTQQQRADLSVAELMGAVRAHLEGRKAVAPVRVKETPRDAAARKAWMGKQAQRLGFLGADDLVSSDVGLFRRLEAQWRGVPAPSMARVDKTKAAKKFPTVLNASGLQLSGTAWQNKPGTRRILTEKHLAGYRKAAGPLFSRGDNSAMAAKKVAGQDQGGAPAGDNQGASMTLFHGGRAVLSSLGGRGRKNRFLYTTPTEVMAKEYGQHVTRLVPDKDARIADLSDPEALYGSQTAVEAIQQYAQENDIDPDDLVAAVADGRAWETYGEYMQDDINDVVGAALGADIIALPDSTFASNPQVQGKTFVVLNKGRIKIASDSDASTSQDAPRLSRAAGGRGFDASNSTLVADFRNDEPLKRHADYKAAKGGDAESAVRLVRDLVKPQSIEAARQQFDKDVTFVPVHAVEASGKNAIPNGLAMLYADALGASVDTGITQSNKAFHTGAGAMERLMNRAEFDGAVEPGKSYVLVDDVTTMGSTLADLAAYIQRNGGRVAGSVVLVNAARGVKLEASPKVINQLEARHGQAIREILGIDAAQLTGPEADYLIGFKSADEIRTRSARARQERIARLDAKALSERASGVEPRLSRAAVPTPTAAAQTAVQRAKAQAQALLTPERIDSLIYNVQDKLIDLKRVREHVQALNGTVTDLNDAYQGEELYHGRVARRSEKFLDKEVKPLMAAMNNLGVRIEQLEQYLHARHAPEANRVLAERNPSADMIADRLREATIEVRDLEKRLGSAQASGAATTALEQALEAAKQQVSVWRNAEPFSGTEAERLSLSGMSDADAKAYLSSLGKHASADLATLAAKVDALQRGTTDALLEYGLQDRESIDAWNKTYQHYVPLHRDEAHESAASHPIGQGFSVRGEASKRRVGSNEKVTHILGHIVMQREAAITRGEKNLVAKQLYLMAKQNPAPEWWSTDRAKVQRTVDKATGLVHTTVDPQYRTRDNAVVARINGREVAVVFNERNERAMRLARALKNLDGSDMGKAFNALTKVTRYFSAINTQYNPVFGVVNFTRDTGAVMLNMKSAGLAGGRKDVLNALGPAYREIWRESRGKAPKNGNWTKLWDQLREDGGTTGYRELFTMPQDRAKALKAELTRGDSAAPMKAGRAVLTLLENYNDAMENATRLAVYKLALDQGMSRQKAASVAKNITVNFNRKGAMGRHLGALYAFFNAAVQGQARMIQTLSGPNGRRIMLAGVALGALNTMLGVMVMGGGDDEDDEWARIPEFVKTTSIVIPTSRTTYVAIPMPLGFNVFPNLGRIATEWAMGLKDKSGGEHAVEMLMAMVDAFNPLGGGGNILQTALPTVADPIAALVQNRDWKNQSIYQEDFNSLDPTPGHMRTKESASVFSKAAAKAINKATGGTDFTPGKWSPTPDQFDFIIGQLTGGVGREAMKLTQTVTAPMSGEELPMHKVPLVGRVVGSTAGASAGSPQFYDNIKKLNTLENEERGRMKHDGDLYAFYRENPAADLIIDGKQAYKQVRQLRKDRSETVKEAAPGYQDEARRIDSDIDASMRALNRAMDSVRRRAAAAR